MKSGELTANQFEVLKAVLAGHAFTQRELADAAGISLGTANTLLHEAEEKGFVSNGTLTDAGRAALEPYKVENAVIMAAGLSSRFVPLSYEKPKGLYKVRGEVLIERQIRQLQEVGITDITVVVGYMKELFFYLEDKFGVKIRVNEKYTKRNNNSTLMLVREQLGNTYICSSDDYFTENIFEPYIYRGYYSVSYFDGQTDEYCVSEAADGTITKVSIGGENAWGMLGHVYFDRAFSENFVKILVDEYDRPATADKLWEDIYIEHLDVLKLQARHYEPGIVYEFDSVKDLLAFDHDFLENVDSKILDNICSTLDCKREDIHDIVRIKEGLTNLSFRFSVGDSTYVYRHPGNGTEEIISRESETFSQGVAKRLQIDETFIYESEKEGWKISRFIPNCEILDYHSEWQVEQAMELVRKLHNSGVESKWNFNLYNNAEEIIELLHKRKYPLAEEFDEMHAVASKLADAAAGDGVKPCLCHNDFYNPNLLVAEGKVYLIDWEYSAMSDYASDLGTFICCSDYTIEEADKALEVYFGRKLTPEERRHCMAYTALAAWYWYVWALYKEATGDPAGEWLYLWHKYAKSYGSLATELYDNE